MSEAPDSWEKAAEATTGLSKLNINASVFVPSINAAEFVPNFLIPDDPPATGEENSISDEVSRSSTPSEPTSTNCSPCHVVDDPKSPLKNKSTKNAATADSWEEAADAVTPSPTHSADTSSMPRTPDEEESEAEGKNPRKNALPLVDDTPDKEPVNVIFIGHVDAGKSTIGGQIMHLTGMVDKRTLEKYEKEAREKNRESWYLSWALDTNLEERDKGKTVECGRAFFETEKKHFTILDAPGHKSFVPNMIAGAAQADVAVLVISARKGEFEAGFEQGGQTREHAMLVKTAGVKKLIVAINKMDDPTVMWAESRYNECKDKLVPYLEKTGFNPAKDIQFMPCSGLTGAGLMDPVGAEAPWYTG